MYELFLQTNFCSWFIEAVRLDLKTESSVREAKNWKRNSTMSDHSLDKGVKSFRCNADERFYTFDVKLQMRELDFANFATSKESFHVQ